MFMNKTISIQDVCKTRHGTLRPIPLSATPQHSFKLALKLTCDICSIKKNKTMTSLLWPGVFWVTSYSIVAKPNDFHLPCHTSPRLMNNHYPNKIYP